MPPAQMADALRLIDAELGAVTRTLAADRAHHIARLAEVIARADRVFVLDSAARASPSR